MADYMEEHAVKGAERHFSMNLRRISIKESFFGQWAVLFKAIL
jgi:hypothetical protein